MYNINKFIIDSLTIPLWQYLITIKLWLASTAFILSVVWLTVWVLGGFWWVTDMISDSDLPEGVITALILLFNVPPMYVAILLIYFKKYYDGK